MHYSIVVVTETEPDYDLILDKMAPFQEYDGCTTPEMKIEAVLSSDRESFLEAYNEVRLMYVNGDRRTYIYRNGMGDSSKLTKEHRQQLEGFELDYPVLITGIPSPLTIEKLKEKTGFLRHSPEKLEELYSNLMDLGHGFHIDRRYYEVIKDNLVIGAACDIYGSEMEYAQFYYDKPACPDNKIPVAPCAEYISGFAVYNKDGEFQGDYYWRNINGYWDWWVIGGRWKDMLSFVADGCIVRGNSAKIKDIDFKLMELELRKAVLDDHITLLKENIIKYSVSATDIYNAWNSEARRKASANDDSSDFWRMQKKYGFSYWWYRDRLEEHEVPEPGSSTLAYGYIHNGQWVSRETKGLWKHGDENRLAWEKMFNEWFITLNPEHYVTIVDIHI